MLLVRQHEAVGYKYQYGVEYAVQRILISILLGKEGDSLSRSNDCKTDYIRKAQGKGMESVVYLPLEVALRIHSLLELQNRALVASSALVDLLIANHDSISSTSRIDMETIQYAYKYSVFLAIEKLPSLEEYVKVIVAHEIAHIYHNYILLEQTETNWESIPLMNGITSMYLEGVATYISKRLVPDMPESVYYSYDDSGEDWFSFCRGNQKEIARAFLEISNWDIDGLREWFRLSGGKIFGYTRLGYFLGTVFIEDKLKEIDEYKIYTLLADESFLSIGNQWLEKTAS